MPHIELDPELVALYTARETATTALTLAQGGLEGAKQAVGGMADVASAIAQYGLGGLLDIRSATFEASLQQSVGGYVLLAMDLEFNGQPLQIDLEFNFNDPLSSAKALAQSLLPS